MGLLRHGPGGLMEFLPVLLGRALHLRLRLRVEGLVPLRRRFFPARLGKMALRREGLGRAVLRRMDLGPCDRRPCFRGPVIDRARSMNFGSACRRPGAGPGRGMQTGGEMRRRRDTRRGLARPA